VDKEISLLEQQLFDQFFQDAPSTIDVDAIWQDWCALKPVYRVEDRYLPLPVWARRSLTETGEQAWSILTEDVTRIDPLRAFAIYIHIPFCARRCDFCDCYSFHLKGHRDEHVEQYIDLLLQEMSLWSELGMLANRPVSTVHLGGGTPTYLGSDAFNRLIAACRTHFAADEQTEWALESTSSDLTEAMFETLDQLNFTRLHIGVQSLQDAVRERIHRQEPAAHVMEKINRAVANDWIVSVDVIAGLPGQTLPGLLGDLDRLAENGVDGFSLYELQLSNRNRQFAERNGLLSRPRCLNYWMMQAASRHLAALGYRKTLFNHYARLRDTNLYFTFPERGEDCLALGTIADGVFGDYHYRHPTYADYRRSVNKTFPGLQGGLRRNATESRLHALTTALLSSTIPGKLLVEQVKPLVLERWLEANLLVKIDSTDDYKLTGNGSWLTGNMMTELVST
jgi:coproporphyrinogen III oxidase-like Fe-S oxidoreductase